MNSNEHKLIQEAFKRFGEIQPDDVFYRPFLNDDYFLKTMPLQDGFEPVFRYNEEEGEQILEFQGIIIYMNGEWATKVEPKPKGVLKFKNDEARMLAEVLKYCKDVFLFGKKLHGNDIDAYSNFLDYLQLKCEKLSKDKRRSGHKTTDTEEDFHNRILKRWTKKQ